MNVAVLLSGDAGPSVALAVAQQLGATSVFAVGLGPAEAPLRAAAGALGFTRLVAAVDPALARVGPRQSGQVLAALLRREQAALLLIDAEADRGEGMLAASAAHHLHAALLLGAERVVQGSESGPLEVALPLAGRRFRLRLSLPAVVVLAPAAAPASAIAGLDVAGITAGDVQGAIFGLDALALKAADLVEPAPPSTARPGQTRPTPIKDLAQLMD